jgi:uncharacterized damage-inducible protein DinB
MCFIDQARTAMGFNMTSQFPALVTPGFVRTMAAYNAGMNQQIYDAATRLSDSARRQQRGAFWGSIHGTLNHLLWADQMWMSRFDGWDKPVATQKDSADLIADFKTLRRAREAADAEITTWASRMDGAWLNEDQTWFSGGLGRDVSMPRGLLMVHFFNHQSHHRGQAHAMITAAGEKTGDTDLFMLPKVVEVALQA